ncbi:hypothetical protein EDB92DRAFT_484583 [Lactarius akahatsu]|uniref:Uncharacterized protein n=1 Tax=Lactarius akahatsu TaxID=416441 RepID=A0AAD4QF64_9AGAM|nr:hypothetical protein EDB92DRAFT_484583 [Lactarius akahatsu]
MKTCSYNVNAEPNWRPVIGGNTPDGANDPNMSMVDFMIPSPPAPMIKCHLHLATHGRRASTKLEAAFSSDYVVLWPEPLGSLQWLARLLLVGMCICVVFFPQSWASFRHHEELVPASGASKDRRFSLGDGNMYLNDQCLRVSSNQSRKPLRSYVGDWRERGTYQRTKTAAFLFRWKLRTWRGTQGFEHRLGSGVGNQERHFNNWQAESATASIVERF